MLHYPDEFYAELAYQLRERNPDTLEDMQKKIISVEENLLDKKSKMKAERRGGVKEEASTPSNTKMDTLVKKWKRGWKG